MEDNLPLVEAIAVRGENIEAVGTNEEILALQEPGATLIDLAGRSLMPGFVDAHTHVLNDARANGRSLDQAQSLALMNGITTIGDLYVEEPFLREMQAFTARGELRLRTSLYLVANTNCGILRGRWYDKYSPTRNPGEMLRIGGVKIFTDGGSCGGVALSFELEPGRGQGDLWLTQEKLNTMVARAQSKGYQVAIHAIGDRAVEQALDAIASALDGEPNIYRHRIEHLSVVRPELIPRFGKLDIVPVIPGEYPACVPFGPPIPEGYREWEWPWRELRRINPDLNIAWHSDYAYWSINPFVHLYGFVTRNDVFQTQTCPPYEWLLDDTLTVQESLSIMTIQSAYALFREDEVGSLRPGKYADLIVISANPLETPAEDLRRLSVLATMVGGRFEHCNLHYAELCPGYQPRIAQPIPDVRPPVPLRWAAAILALVLPLSMTFPILRKEKKHWLVRLSGAAGVIGGGIFLWGTINAGLQASLDLITWPMVAAGILLAIAIIGLASVLRKRILSAIGLITAWLGIIGFSLGFILMTWFRVDIAWLITSLSLIVHMIALIIIGLGSWRDKGISFLNRLPLLFGLVGILLPFGLGWFTGDFNKPFEVLGYILGLGWALMGILIYIAGQISKIPESE